MPVKQPTKAQIAAAQARHEAAAISPMVAGQMGDALGGPNDLPTTGSAPGGNEPARQGILGPLPDDRDALRDVGALPSDAPPKPPAPREPAVLKRPGRQHPLLTKLRQDLGLDAIPMHDVQVGGHEWRLGVLSADDVALASRLADQLSESVVEHHMIHNAALVAHAIVAIDGVPVYQVFDVEPGPIPIQDPFRPPRSIKHTAAVRLHEFITRSRPLLPQRLWEAYVDRCDAESSVASYLDEPGQRRVTFRCGELGCDDNVTIKPRLRDGDVVLPFCRWHATPMQPEEDQDPLA